MGGAKGRGLAGVDVLRGVTAAFILLFLQVQASSIAVARPDAAAETVIIGRVVAIADGDTLTVLTEARQQVRGRLAGIDTPERAQPYGSRARQELSELAFGKQARVAVHDTDRYGRTVGRVHAEGRDVNAEMVRRGVAWVYRRYSSDATLLALEAEARESRRGLWALPEAERVPPWEWRAARRGEKRPAQ